MRTSCRSEVEIKIMPYTLGEIKIAAYNRDEKPDYSVEERNLFLGLAYCYDAFRAGYPKEDCDKLSQTYIQFYERSRLKEVK